MWNLTRRFANLGDEYLTFVKPTALCHNLNLVHKNSLLLQDLNLQDISDEELIAILSGQSNLDYESFASIYMGHQFGVLVPQLGDGRAITIGEHQDNKLHIWELQLKGAGKTRFSRMGDGRAVLRSSIREYLVSHLMKSLDINTTEALAIISSTDQVYRETPETAAIVLRVASSFLRFGHFEYFAYHHKPAELKKLIDFTIINYFPHIPIDSSNYIAMFLQEVVRSTAITIAKWQSVGFVHGVMNTDNMSILGLTIDYGPFAFMDNFSPKKKFNHSDNEGRYTYANQPQMAWWNLYRLAEALLALDNTNEQALQLELDSFAEHYNNAYQDIMWQKMGIIDYRNIADKALLNDILIALEQNNIDWTFFWRQLSCGDSGINKILSIYPNFDFTTIYTRLIKCYSSQTITQSVRETNMQAINPAFILRTHLLHDAIEKAKREDYSEVDILFKLCSQPYNEQDEFEYYYQLPPIWATHLELSCSS